MADIVVDLEAMNDIYDSLDKDDMSACYFLALRALVDEEGIINIHNKIMDELTRTQESAGGVH